MAKPKKKNDGITPAIIVSHIHAMGQRLEEKIDGVEKSLRKEIREFKEETAASFAEVHRSLNLLSVQIDNIDKRLDDLEVYEIPKIKKAIGMR